MKKTKQLYIRCVKLKKNIVGCSFVHRIFVKGIDEEKEKEEEGEGEEMGGGESGKNDKEDFSKAIVSKNAHLILIRW